MNRLSDRKSGGARPSATGSRADASSPQAVSTEGFDPARKHHPLLAVGEIPCRSCPNDFPYPALYIASATRISDLPPLDWPVCEMHSQHAMVAGWFPFRTIDEWRAALGNAGDAQSEDPQ